ncbi:MAG: hypothetical protein V4524_03010 [Patescibacteria group bacterium]
MKTIMVVLTVVCTFFSLITEAVGETLTNLPINSTAQMRNYGLSIAQFGWRQAYTYNNTSPSRPYTDAISEFGAEAILDRLVATDFTFIGGDTNDTVGDQIMLSDGGKTDWGYSYLASGYTTYKFGMKPGYHAIWLQDIPLLMINDASSAEVKSFRPDGTDGYTWHLNVINGHPCLSPWFGGSENGALIVHYLDGSSSTNQLSKPTAAIDEPAPVEHQWKIQGHYVRHITRAKETIKIVEQNNDPTLYVEVKNPSSITFDVMGLYQDQYGFTDTERPVTMEIDFVGGGHLTISGKADRSIEHKFARGVKFRAYFTWNKFDKGSPLYTGDYNGGGGEKGIATVVQ